jgi:hypothetical protein
MTELEKFERWAAAARGEPAPTLDVADRVLRDLRYPNGRAGLERPLMVWAGLSVAAAAAVCVLAYQDWTLLTDPMSGLFDTLNLVMR